MQNEAGVLIFFAQIVAFYDTQMADVRIMQVFPQLYHRSHAAFKALATKQVIFMWCPVIVLLSAVVVKYDKRIVFNAYLLKLLDVRAHLICLVHVAIKNVGEGVDNYDVGRLLIQKGINTTD